MCCVHFRLTMPHFRPFLPTLSALSNKRRSDTLITEKKEKKNPVESRSDLAKGRWPARRYKSNRVENRWATFRETGVKSRQTRINNLVLYNCRTKQLFHVHDRTKQLSHVSTCRMKQLSCRNFQDKANVHHRLHDKLSNNIGPRTTFPYIRCTTKQLFHTDSRAIYPIL